MKIGNLISDLRRDKNLTLTDLAHKSSISKSYLSKIENDLQMPDLDKIESICDALEIPIEIFFLKAAQRKDDSPISSLLDKILPELDKIYPFFNHVEKEQQQLKNNFHFGLS